MATIQTLLNNALYKSTNDRQYDPIQVGGGRINVALNLLIGLFDEYRNEVPFTQEEIFSTYAELTSTAFNSVVHVDYTLGDVKYPLVQRDLTRFNEESVVLNLKSIPQIYYFNELTKTISVYPEPQDNTNDFIVHGYKDLGAIVLTTTIPANMPRFMQDFLEYELARRLCDEYGVEWTQQKEQTLQKLYRRLMDSKDIDLTPDADRQFVRPSSGNAPWPQFYYLSGGS